MKIILNSYTITKYYEFYDREKKNPDAGGGTSGLKGESYEKLTYLMRTIFFVIINEPAVIL